MHFITNVHICSDNLLLQLCRWIFLACRLTELRSFLSLARSQRLTLCRFSLHPSAFFSLSAYALCMYLSIMSVCIKAVESLQVLQVSHRSSLLMLMHWTVNTTFYWSCSFTRKHSGIVHTQGLLRSWHDLLPSIHKPTFCPFLTKKHPLWNNLPPRCVPDMFRLFILVLPVYENSTVYHNNHKTRFPVRTSILYQDRFLPL